MTGLNFEKANFILSTKEKLPRYSCVLYREFLCLYLVFMLCLYCTYHVSYPRRRTNQGIEILIYFVSYN